MTTVERAWRAFLAAVAEAKELHTAGAATELIRDLLEHARELLEIIDDEIELNGQSLSAEARRGLDYLRKQLTTAESGLATRH